MTARLLVTKSKSYWSIFCRIRSEFFKIQHSTTSTKFVYLRLVEFTKNTHVSPILHDFLFYQIVVSISPIHPKSSNHLTPRNCCSDPSGNLRTYYTQKLVLRIINKIPEHLTPRDCYSGSSVIFRTSYSKKLLLRIISNFQNILLPDIVTPVHQ